MPGWLRRAVWYHPEWTAALVAVASWVLLVLLHRAPPGAHANDWLAAQGGWLLTATAMMLPSALPTARYVAMNSRWHRRQRAGALFVGSYLAVWSLFGIVAVSVVRGLRLPAGNGWPLALALFIAASWELTAVQRRWLRACHRTWPLPPDGWKADAACIRFGLRHAASCVAACWALMLPMTIAGHTDLLLMLILTPIVVTQLVLVKGARLGRAAALVLVAAATAVAATVWLGSGEPTGFPASAGVHGAQSW